MEWYSLFRHHILERGAEYLYEKDVTEDKMENNKLSLQEIHAQKRKKTERKNGLNHISMVMS